MGGKKIPPQLAKHIFKPGKSGNPLGGSHPNYRLALKRRRFEEETVDALYEIFKLKPPALAKIIRELNQSSMVIWAARIILKGIETGNPVPFSMLVEIVIGKNMSRDKLSEYEMEQIIKENPEIINSQDSIDLGKVSDEDLNIYESLHNKYSANSPSKEREEKKTA